MKNLFINPRNLLQLAMVITVAGFCSVAQAQVVVNLNVSTNQDALVISTPGTCSRANTPGCIRAAGQTTINFDLTGSKDCSRAAGARWELVQVVLGGKNATSKPASWGGLDSEVSEDFNANPATGVVTPHSSSANHILIMDRNTHRYDIWYKVIAYCQLSDEILGTIESDPRIENDGGGN